MEAASLAFSVAQTLFAALQSSELRDIFSKFGHQSELEKLKETIEAAKCGLLAAHNVRGELNSQSKHLLEKLTPVVYDADDLLDKFTTVAKREMQRLALIQEAGGRSCSKRLIKKVHSLSPSFKLWRLASKMSPEIHNIMNKLNKITNDANISRLIVDANNLGISFDNQIIREWREPACSYVDESSIIGREDDTRMIVDMLLDPNFEDQSDRQPPVLSIVGVGGMGKTALAQLVFNNKTIEAEFPLTLWVCVADQDQSQLSVKNVLGSILKSATNEKHIDTLSIEQLQKRIREKLDGNKYLLVLDDIWTEEREKLLNLKQFFSGCQRGSRIVVTTRSRITAENIGSSDKLTYELQGLSDNNSWRLFEAMVGEEQANCPDLVDIGRSIVKKCVNVPLAIKVIGTLLYRQDKSKWRSIHNSNFIEIQNGDNNIMKILKFSYDHLTPSLKSCFSYCAIFPKDCVIEKEMLISLWMAQGYVEPLVGEPSMEDAADENFLILVRRCFFQDIKKDKYGEIVSCKIHDLMHDVALAVTKKEICIGDVDSMSSIDENIRHVSRARKNWVKSFSTMSKLRTYLDDRFHWESKRPVQLALGELPAKLKCLRALDLSYWGIRSLPDTIGGLLHLRYLDLSNNFKLEVLPKSITQLHNLQTLLLVGCSKLRELPSDSSRLVNLRVLDITSCDGLMYMPSGMKKLTSLCKLGMFIVGGRSSEQRFGELEDLGALNKLKGSLKIQFSEKYRYAKIKHGEGGRYLIDKEHLNGIDIRWDRGSSYEGVVQEHEALLEDELQPHCNLRELSIWDYKGERVPRWAKEDKLATSLPHLVKIELYRCEGLKELPWVSKLGCLKRLTLYGLENVEYIEENKNTSSYGGDGERESSLGVIFFPALEELSVWDMPKLKGWWGGSGVDSDSDSNRQPASSAVLPLPCFPRLSELTISKCPDLTSFPPCPNLITLNLRKGVNERLRIITIKEEEGVSGGSIMSSSSSSCPCLSTLPKLRKVKVRNLENLKCLQRGAFGCLREMTISSDYEVKSLSEIDEEVFRTCSSSLRSLKIEKCNKLKSISAGGGGLEHLIALEQLSLKNLEELSFDEDDMPWRSFGQSLRSLEFSKLTKMEKLPKGMCHLTSLHSLTISFCRELEELPEWIGDGCFSSLQSLEIWRCPKMELLPDEMRNLTSLTKLKIWACPPILEERCRSPDGEDWPKIRHIPNIDIQTEQSHTSPSICVKVEVCSFLVDGYCNYSPEPASGKLAAAKPPIFKTHTGHLSQDIIID